MCNTTRATGPVVKHDVPLWSPEGSVVLAGGRWPPESDGTNTPRVPEGRMKAITPQGASYVPTSVQANFVRANFKSFKK
jgi:hypothetical protein